MKIITCLKEVAGRDTRYKISSDGAWIDESDITQEINECDEYSLEESLKLQEKHGGSVTIVTLGRPSAEKAIRKGLAMGAERALHIVDETNKASSPHAVAATLAAALAGEEYDLILAGTQSDDFSYAQTGVILAELLGLPHATIVMEVQVDPSSGKLKALREMESGWFQWVELPLPAVLMIQAGISQVRYPSLRGIMQAKKKEIRKVPIDSLGVDWGSIPKLEVLKLSFPEAASKAEILEGDPAAAASLLLEKLRKEAKVL